MVMAVAQKSQSDVKVRNTRDGIDAPTQRWKPHRSDVCTEVLRLIGKLGAVPAEPLMLGALIRTPASLDEIEQALADLVRQGLLVQQARNGEIMLGLSAQGQRKQQAAPALRAVAQVRGITEDPFAPRSGDAALRAVAPRARQASEQPFTDVRAQSSGRRGRLQRESEHPFTDVQRDTRVGNRDLAQGGLLSQPRRVSRESEFPFTDLTQGKAPGEIAAVRAVRAAFEPPTLRAPELTAELLRSIAIAAGAQPHATVEPMQRRPESTPAPALARAQLANPADVLTISMVDAKLIGPELVARAQQALAPRTAPPVPPPGGRTAQVAPLAAPPAAMTVARGSHAAIAVPSTALTEPEVTCGRAACAADAASDVAVSTVAGPAAATDTAAVPQLASAPAPAQMEAVVAAAAVVASPVAAAAVVTAPVAAPTDRVEEIARLEVALDAERERLVLYRLGVVMLTLTGLVLARQLFLV